MLSTSPAALAAAAAASAAAAEADLPGEHEDNPYKIEVVADEELPSPGSSFSHAHRQGSSSPGLPEGLQYELPVRLLPFLGVRHSSNPKMRLLG